MHGAVVGENLELVRGECHREEEIVILFAGVIRVGGAAGGCGTGCGRRTVMSVGNIEIRNFVFEHRGKFAAAFRSGFPEFVFNAVGGDEREIRFFLFDFIDDVGDSGIGTVGQEDRTGVIAQFHDVPCAVIFLVTAGLFMFLDDVGIVIRRGCCTRDSGLGTVAHAEGVDIQIGFGIGFERGGGNETFEVFTRFGINGVGVQIGSGGEFDFRAGYPQETQRIAFGESRGFFAVDHVIGYRRHFRHFVRTRHQCMKRMKNCHKNIS